jgi:hypothetical protein
VFDLGSVRRAAPDASASVVILHDLHPDGLAAALKKFFPKYWRVVQDETWSPADDGLVHGEVGITTYGAPDPGGGSQC